MMEERRADARDAVEAARRDAIVGAAAVDLARDPGPGGHAGPDRRARRPRAPSCGSLAELPPAGAGGLGPPRGRRMRGQGMVEYGLILALTAVLTVVILGVFGGTLADVLGAIGAAIDAATGGD